MTDITDAYSKIVQKRFLFIFLFLVLSSLLSFVNLIIGPIKLSPFEILQSLISPSEDTISIVVWGYRLPWTLMAVLVGGALGLAGLQMQTILNNPLASPYTLGISSGAGFGAALAYVLGIYVIAVPSEFIVPINAFVFSFLTCMLILTIGKIRGFTSETLILGGIAISFMFQSLLALLQYYASEEALQAIVFWLFGSLTKASLLKAQIVAVVLIAVTILLLFRSWKITALRLGEEKAKSLGVDVESLRVEILLYVSILTSVAICFVGVIGFVGLVAPHIARILLGEDQRFLIVGSILCGGLILSAGAVASKTIVPGAIFPIGIITSMLGIPFFLFLVLKGRREIW
ncbi:iron ABC transporter permease [Ferroglobus sp.]|uniref:FecCD family ABC transporter permease n=1 Tax=Ferroglobus sp. TaxID=2614230 RepID=UPI0025C0A6C2|nr:iron ABC transporter permease [Ferroglobus sp.]